MKLIRHPSKTNSSFGPKYFHAFILSLDIIGCENLRKSDIIDYLTEKLKNSRCQTFAITSFFKVERFLVPSRHHILIKRVKLMLSLARAELCSSKVKAEAFGVSRAFHTSVGKLKLTRSLTFCASVRASALITAISVWRTDVVPERGHAISLARANSTLPVAKVAQADDVRDWHSGARLIGGCVRHHLHQ